MAHEDTTPRHEIHRAKTLAARFERLQLEIAAFDPLPSMDPSLELDAETRAVADEWLDSHTPRPTYPAPNPTPVSGRSVRA